MNDPMRCRLTGIETLYRRHRYCYSGGSGRRPLKMLLQMYVRMYGVLLVRRSRALLTDSLANAVRSREYVLD